MTKSVPLPEPIIAILRDIVDKIPDDEIIDYAGKHRGEVCQGGFKPERKNVTVFRNRLKSMVRGSMVATGHPLLDVLRLYDLSREFVIVLSPMAVQYGLESFLAYFGKERFLANVLLDEREEVRQLAHAYLAQSDWQERALPDRAQAVKEIRESFAPFLKHLLPFVRDDQSEDGDALQEKDAQISSTKADPAEMEKERTKQKSHTLAAEARGKAELEKTLKHDPKRAGKQTGKTVPAKAKAREAAAKQK
jgi:hypothetical protein